MVAVSAVGQANTTSQGSLFQSWLLHVGYHKCQGFYSLPLGSVALSSLTAPLAADSFYGRLEMSTCII